jgi:osmotically-inducible protein OsmY
MTNITRKLATLAGILFVAMALGCASTSKQESTGQYLDDTAITGKVKTAIFNEPTLKSAEINVETFKGVVQLSGFVSSADNERLAMQVARNVGGVKSVKNDMRLK